MAQDQPSTTHGRVLEILDTILNDFGLSRSNGSSRIELQGQIPAARETNSEHIDMSLTGAIPSLANAIAASQIFEARGGKAQTISVDLQRAHNYLNPDIGMTPKINGQVRSGWAFDCPPSMWTDNEQSKSHSMLCEVIHS